MDRNLKIIASAAAGLAVICIAIFVIFFILNYHIAIPGGSSSGSLFFSYSKDDGAPLNQTQYTQNGTLAGRVYVEGDADTLLMALRDYNVTAFYYNGSVNKTHMIAKNAYINESGWVISYDPARPRVPFNVTGIPDGFHDVELLGFVDPYNFTGNDWRADGPFAASGIRFNVIANDSKKTIPALTDGPASNETIYSTTNPFGGPYLSKEPFFDRLWKKESVEGGSVVDYYVSLKTPMIDDKMPNYRFAIIQLLDYEQVPIRVGSTDMTYYGYLESNTSAAVHLSVRAPDTVGGHKLVVIVAGDPYADLEVAPYVENNQTWTTNKNASTFTSIEHQDVYVI